MSRTEYLVDILHAAAVEAPGDNYVELQRVTIGREVETAIFHHPTSTIVFPPLEVGAGATLHFGCGVKETAWQRIENEVRFSISVLAGEKRKQVFQTEIDPRTRPRDRAWQRHSLDLSRFAGQHVQLILETSVPRRRSSKYAWASWANPRITHDAETRRPTVARRDEHPHIFLITTDALPARYLECYGHAQVKTPHLNRLAADGVLFEDAWSQSCMTLGSYASILTSRHPHEHGVNKEWDPFPAHQLSLPVALAGFGYHTLSSISSIELAERGLALPAIFAETLPMLANPMQDGTITTRRFAHWLAARPDKPCFCWIHYFDTHPPSVPPEPYRSMYYTGDPTDESRRHKTEQLAKIRGVESVLVIMAAWPLLEKGVSVYEVKEILEDTAAVLMGRSDFKPDLAEHVLRLGAPAMKGLSASQFGQWLAKQTREMSAGNVPGQLLSWLEDVMKMLRMAEQDVISWLNGVVDFRFPVSMYLGSISYMDSQVGALVRALREEGIYDQSLIIFTSPHGEILDDPVLPFHHFVLAPDTLRVPLIIKPPARKTDRSGARLGGVFDLIDLFPTILDMQGLQNSFRFSGVTRWENIRSGADIPPHDTFSTGFSGVAHSVYRPPHLLVKEREMSHHATLQTLLSKGAEVVHDTVSRETSSTAQVAASDGLRDGLALWRQRFARLA